MRVFTSGVDLPAVLARVREVGYAFVADAITPTFLAAFKEEIDRLPLEFGDHERRPINRGAANEVRQRHERCYRALGHPDVPAATAFCHAAAAEVGALGETELIGWIPKEIGYQRYCDAAHWISPHVDRRSDRLLSLTVTIAGTARIRIHEALTDPVDYARLRQVDEFLAGPGTAMFLRAPGYAGGGQVIHEVDPPLVAPREIVNLRMRETLLAPPSETP